MEEYFPKEVLDDLGRAIQEASCLERTLAALSFAALGGGGVLVGYLVADDLGMYVGGGLGALLAWLVIQIILRVGHEFRARRPRQVPAYDRQQSSQPLLATPAPAFADNELSRIDEFLRGLDGKGLDVAPPALQAPPGSSASEVAVPAPRSLPATRDRPAG